MITLKDKLKTSCLWVEVDSTLNNLNNNNMHDKPDYTCDINLKTYFHLLYNVNCNVNEKMLTTKEEVDGVLVGETINVETRLRPMSVLFSDIAPTVILKDGNENVSVLEYNVMNKHWFEIKDLVKHNLLHSLGMCV